MVHKEIYSHRDLQALGPIVSQAGDERVYVRIVSLDSVRISHESCALLRPLVNQVTCLCPQLDFLSIVACLSLELRKVERDILPPLQDPEAKLDTRVVEVLLSMKSSAITLLRLRKEFINRFGRFGEDVEDDLIPQQVLEVGLVLKDTACQLLEGTPIRLLKERFPYIGDLVRALLAFPVRFL